jgi:hypothetical protein
LKLVNHFVSFSLRSHLIVSIAATVLAYQSLLLTGDYSFRNPLLLLIFFGTIFVYNLAHCIIDLPSKESKKIFRFNRDFNFHLILCLISFVFFMVGFVKTNTSEKIIIFITGICTLAYEMPFAKNSQRLRGVRNIPVLKNILLAGVWAVATAWLPLTGKTATIHSLDLTFIFLKRFFFVLPLCMVFDIRDQWSDLKNNIRTIPNQVGIPATKNLSYLAMMFFVIVVYLHKKSMEAIGSPLLDFSVPLYISAVMASVFIYLINEEKKNAYYIFVIDGSMILQFLLVYLFILF